MVFSSVLFLYYFLPAVLLVYYMVPKIAKNAVLFVFSLVFYAWGEPTYIFLMLLSIVFNYFMCIFMDRLKTKKSKTAILVSTVVADLSILGFYKYAGFFTGIVNSVFKTNLPILSITLPIGISFYTFQIISYVIDVYRNNAKVQKNFISIGTYITLFPQLIAGPIVRYNTIDEQLSERKETADMFFSGVSTFCVGLSKKVFLANNIGMIWETVKTTEMTSMSVMGSWLGIIAFALQIYFDFSGYSDMAIGLGRMFGFEFDINFNYPYISKSITEFWRRWHISLSTWFREYVYIPLGGSRCTKRKMCLNLMIVWLLTGLWHGASYNFVLWGVYYGVLLITEKLFLKRILNKFPKFISHIYALFFVLIGWVFFASDDITSAFNYLKSMFGVGVPVIGNSFLYDLRSNFVFLVVGLLASLPVFKELYLRIPERIRKVTTVMLCVLSVYVCTAYLLDSTYNPFLYFRF